VKSPWVKLIGIRPCLRIASIAAAWSRGSSRLTSPPMSWANWPWPRTLRRKRICLLISDKVCWPSILTLFASALWRPHCGSRACRQSHTSGTHRALPRTRCFFARGVGRGPLPPRAERPSAVAARPLFRDRQDGWRLRAPANVQRESLDV